MNLKRILAGALAVACVSSVNVLQLIQLQKQAFQM